MSIPDKNKASNKASKSASNTKTPSKVSSLETKQKQAKNNPKKLTLTNINKLASKFNEKRKVYLDVNGESFEVLVNVTFRRSEVERSCLEFLEIFSKSLQLEGIDETELMKNIENFLQVYILKNFTNIPIPKDIDNISKLITLTNNLYDLGILREFFIDNVGLIGEANFKLISETFNKIAQNIGKTLSDKVLLSELEKNRIDVDDYFSELEMRNFEIVDDEDLSLLPKVIKQLEEDGLYDEYMSQLTNQEMEKLQQRLDMLDEVKKEEDSNGE